MNLTFPRENPYPQQMSNRQGTAGDIRRTSTSWSILPDDVIINLLQYLPYKDLVHCKTLDRRTARIIRDNLLLSLAYWRQFPKPPTLEQYTVHEYQRTFRSWLRQAKDQHSVYWLDSLKLHKQFPKLLFYTVCQTLEQAKDWKLEERQCLNQNIQNVSPDGESIVVSEGGFNLCVKTRKYDEWVKSCLINHSHYVRAVHFSSDGLNLVTASKDGTFCVARLECCQWEICCHTPFQGELSSVTFDRDSLNLALSTYDGTLFLMAFKEGRWIEVERTNCKKKVLRIQFIQGCSSLAMCTYPHAVSVLRKEQGGWVEKYSKQLDSYIWFLEVGPCDDSLVCTNEAGDIFILTHRNGQWQEFCKTVNRVTPLSDAPHTIDSKGISKCRDNADCTVSITSRDQGSQRWRFYFTGIDFSLDGHTFATTAVMPSGILLTILCLEGESWKTEYEEFLPRQQGVVALKLSPLGNLLWSVHNDSTFRIYKRDDKLWRLIHKETVFSEIIESISYDFLKMTAVVNGNTTRFYTLLCQ